MPFTIDRRLHAVERDSNCPLTRGIYLYKYHGLAYNCTPFVGQYTILSNKWGAFHFGAAVFCLFQ